MGEVWALEAFTPHNQIIFQLNFFEPAEGQRIFDELSGLMRSFWEPMSDAMARAVSENQPHIKSPAVGGPYLVEALGWQIAVVPSMIGVLKFYPQTRMTLHFREVKDRMASVLGEDKVRINEPPVM